MTALALAESRELAHLAGLLQNAPRGLIRPNGKVDTVIVIHLGPGQTPEVASILRSQWPTITTLNHVQGAEFHVRLRQHTLTGVCLVYASVSISSKNRHQKSIFGDVVQRGRVVKTPQQIEAAILEIRRELGIEKKAELP